MMNVKQNIPNIAKEKFKRKVVDVSLQEKIERPSLTFWQDAAVRLMKNRGAVIGMLIALFLVVMAIFGPYMNQYKYDEQIAPISQHTKLPPRIPGLEKLGIFDGTVTKEIGEKGLKRYKEGQYKIIKKFEKYNKNSKQKTTKYKIKEYTYIKKGIQDEYFWFGTDDLGRDLWTRTWKGARVSLYIGLLAALMDLIIGVSYGSISGFYGGKVDIYMMRFIEIISGIPALVVVTLFILALKPGLLSISLAIGLTGWIGMARIVRSQFLKLKNQEFVLASRTLGTPNRQIIFKHILPNVVGQVIIMITFTIPGAISYEAFLAFIGLGLPAPNASLGVLANDGYKFIQTYPHMMIIPSIVISLLMLSLNIFANGLRDALDPKMRNQ